MTQHGVFDAEQAKAAREEAVARVDRHAPPSWKEQALRAVWEVATEEFTFTTDDVWKRLGAPPEPRALGPVMREAEKRGYCEQTDQWTLSIRASRHRAPIRVWASKLGY